MKENRSFEVKERVTNTFLRVFTFSSGMDFLHGE